MPHTHTHTHSESVSATTVHSTLINSVFEFVSGTTSQATDAKNEHKYSVSKQTMEIKIVGANSNECKMKNIGVLL